jgi:type IV pilus assembly protein PilW
MSIPITLRQSPRPARGFSLVELMVTVSIAIFLVGGLLTILQNVRTTYNNQQKLVQLQDEQRFALSVINDAVQAAGYFPDPTAYTIDTSFPASGAFASGSVFAGTHPVNGADNIAQDTLSTRFWTNLHYGPVLCNGVDSSQLAGPTMYTVTFSLGTNPVTNNPALMCSVNGGTAFALVDNVTAMAVYYGVKRDLSLVDYNVDTYENWDVVAASGTDAENVSSVRIVITFQNPLSGQPGQQNSPTITLERVIEVMGRGGPYT